MSLRNSIKIYKDVNGYVNPYPVDPASGRNCDNSTMFTSELYLLLTLRDENCSRDADEWENLITKSSVKPGLTVRYPGDTSVDAPDNIYAILAAAKVLNKPKVALDMLNYGLSNLGFYNPSNPGHVKNIDGTVNWSTFQWRQLQMLFAMICASNSYKWYKFWYWPLEVYTSLVIAVSSIGVPPEETDPRRLSWLLIQATKQDSKLCLLASRIWEKRLYKDYGALGMESVSAIYFNPKGINNNPFSTYGVFS